MAYYQKNPQQKHQPKELYDCLEKTLLSCLNLDL